MKKSKPTTHNPQPNFTLYALRFTHHAQPATRNAQPSTQFRG